MSVCPQTHGQQLGAESPAGLAVGGIAIPLSVCLSVLGVALPCPRGPCPSSRRAPDVPAGHGAAPSRARRRWRREPEPGPLLHWQHRAPVASGVKWPQGPRAPPRPCPGSGPPRRTAAAGVAAGPLVTGGRGRDRSPRTRGRTMATPACSRWRRGGGAVLAARGPCTAHARSLPPPGACVRCRAPRGAGPHGRHHADSTGGGTAGLSVSAHSLAPCGAEETAWPAV